MTHVHFVKILWAAAFIGLVVISSRSGSAQEDAAAPQPTLNLYSCEFIPADNAARLHVALFDPDGRAVQPGDFVAAVTNADSGEAIASDRLAVRAVAPRPPLELILVLDITDTVPVTEVVNAISAELMPELIVEDQVALITFADSVSPRTRFYTDKNQLVNEHLLDLLTVSGDNRIYDAIFAAVTNFPAGTTSRHVVLVLTDSALRDITDQTAPDQIIEQAARNNVEIHVIGFNTFLDQPDTAQMQALTSATSGYFWLYDAPFISRAGIEAGVGDFLDDFTELIDAEYQIDIDLDGQQPNPNGLIRFTVDAAFANELKLADEILCAVEDLQHSIIFASDLDGRTIRTPTDIAVTVESDLSRDDTVVRFLRSGEIVQEGAGDVYTFDPTGLQPGFYEIGAQLINRSGDVLASTPVVLRLYVQAALELTVEEDENGGAVFALSADPALDLPPASIDIAPAANADTPQPLSDEPLAFENGAVVLPVANLRQRALDLFPNAQSDRFRVVAYVPGIGAGDPPLAISDPFTLTIAAPPQPQPQPPAPAVVLPAVNFNISAPLLSLIVSLALLVVNILLFQAVKRARVRSVINTPDDYELSPQLMTITVRREGVRQSHALTRKTITIGRGSSNDINLGDDPNISRQHSVIIWRNGTWYYTNRKPRVVSRINNKRYRGYHLFELKPVTEIEIGQALLVFHSSAQQDISEFIDTNL